MTEPQRLFLVQARSDFAVFELLRDRSDLEACHALHYLQMATELLGKALDWKHGKPKKSHRAFVKFLRDLSFNRGAQKELGYARKNEAWRQVIRTSVRLAEAIENLAPSLAGDGPNPEYPWPEDAPEHAPVEHPFAIWDEFQTTSGRQFLRFIHDLFGAAETFL